MELDNKHHSIPAGDGETRRTPNSGHDAIFSGEIYILVACLCDFSFFCCSVIAGDNTIEKANETRTVKKEGERDVQTQSLKSSFMRLS